MFGTQNSKKKDHSMKTEEELLKGLAFLLGGFFVLLLLLFILPVCLLAYLLSISLVWFCKSKAPANEEPDRTPSFFLKAYLLLTFLYYVFIGPFWSSGNLFYEGILFYFFTEEVRSFVSWIMIFVNGHLPQKLKIQHIDSFQIQKYLWSSLPVSVLFSFLLLFFKKNPLGVLFGNVSVHLPFIIKSNFKSQQNMKVLIGHFKDFWRKPLYLDSSQLVRHTYILGASGFGKSNLLNHIIKNRIQLNFGLLFLDLKSDIETIKFISKICLDTKRFHNLKFFSLSNPEISHYYNILGHGSANQLKDKIMGAFEWSEEFYKNESSSILLKILRSLVFLRDHKKEIIHLKTLLYALSDPQYLSSRVLNKLPLDEEDLRSEISQMILYLSSKSSYKNLQGLRTQIEGLLLSDFGPKLCPGSHDYEIDLLTAVQRKEVIYFLLDSRRYGESAKSLGKMILQDLKAVSSEIDGSEVSTSRSLFNIVIDEFSDLAVPEFLEFLDRARSSGLGTILAHQELSDLKKVSPEYATRLLNLTSTIFAFLTKIPESAELLSSIVGTQKSWRQTERASRGFFGFDQMSGEKSLREVEEFILHPNVLKNLKVGECIVVGKYPKSFQGVLEIKGPDSNSMTEYEVKELFYELQKRVPNEKPPKALLKSELEKEDGDNNKEVLTSSSIRSSSFTESSLDPSNCSENETAQTKEKEEEQKDKATCKGTSNGKNTNEIMNNFASSNKERTQDLARHRGLLSATPNRNSEKSKMGIRQKFEEEKRE